MRANFLLIFTENFKIDCYIPLAKATGHRNAGFENFKAQTECPEFFLKESRYKLAYCN